MDAKDREALAGLIEQSCAIEGEPGHESVVLFHEPVVMERIESLISSALAEKDAEIARLADDRVLTCVYCGQAYPPGTPSHGSQVLTDHIKICKKHPMRDAEAKIETMRRALVGMVGAESREELASMAIVLECVDDDDAKAALGAIRALQALLPPDAQEVKP